MKYLNLRNWFIRKLLPKPTPKIIPMEERTAWQVYQDMNAIPQIKDLFELRRQAAYIQAAKNKSDLDLGIITDIEEIMENMEVASERLEEFKQQPVTKESPGYKSSVE